MLVVVAVLVSVLLMVVPFAGHVFRRRAPTESETGSYIGCALLLGSIVGFVDIPCVGFIHAFAVDGSQTSVLIDHDLPSGAATSEFVFAVLAGCLILTVGAVYYYVPRLRTAFAK